MNNHWILDKYLIIKKIKNNYVDWNETAVGFFSILDSLFSLRVAC